ncbi:matrix metalloproteinase-16-like [Lytechinus variegatus]|uniref:matrix metalloproteinase-16-like n=1 Tax=Lytechinus variegatus TaxID=7654 RepID=UPI001BB258A8|nr:matrix metalloproteinase-16-like [Lytechinus variegatus]
MMPRLALLSFGCYLAAIGSMGAPMIETEQQMASFLNKYGYLKDSDMVDGMPKNEMVMRRAIMYFQKMGNIPMTGTLNNESKALMNTPRCGMKDMDTFSLRKKRYSTRNPWPKSDLTWNILIPTSQLPLPDQRRIMQDALKVWSDVSNLNFDEVNVQDPDIKIIFARGEHGDPGPDSAFDGRSNVLAHAYFPQPHPLGGDAHFDDDEHFTAGTRDGTNLFQVAAHEFGHSLGLGHSDVEGALMGPYYRGYQPNFQLHDDDIAGIRRLYGERVEEGRPEERSTPSTPTSSTPSTPKSDCMTQISFATRTRDGSTYLGNETHVFRRNGDTILDGYPKKIEVEFPDLETNLDAALYYPYNGNTYFFKGSEYWIYSNQYFVDRGEISNLVSPRLLRYGYYKELPSNIDSAFVWGRTGHIFVTKGDEYYLFYLGYGVHPNYPQPLSQWRGLPSEGVDAAFQDYDGYTYFFKGTDHYRFNDYDVRVDVGYPMETAFTWFGCDASAYVVAGGDGDAATIIPSVAAIVFSLLSAIYVF